MQTGSAYLSTQSSELYSLYKANRDKTLTPYFADSRLKKIDNVSISRSTTNYSIAYLMSSTGADHSITIPTYHTLTGDNSTTTAGPFLHTEAQYRDIGYIIGVTTALCVLILLTIIGNIFVVVAVKLEKSLHSCSYYLILSLALTDILVALLAMPFSILDMISDVWFLGKALCDLWITFDVLCCTSSILHLVFISFDRYWAVTNVSYTHANKIKRIALLIMLAWCIALLVAVTPFFGWKDPSNNPELTGDCLISQDKSYTVFSTVSAFYLPAGLMFIVYVKIYKVARASIRKERFKRDRKRDMKKEYKSLRLSRFLVSTSSYNVANMQASICDETENGNNESETGTGSKVSDNRYTLKKESVSGNESDITSNGNLSLNDERRKSSLIKTENKNGNTCSSVLLEVPQIHSNGFNLQSYTSDDTDGDQPSDHPDSYVNLHHPTKLKARPLRRPRSQTLIPGTSSTDSPIILSFLGPPRRYSTGADITSKFMFEENVSDFSKSAEVIFNAKKEKIKFESKKERKAAVTLAIITGAFIICWLPFFIVALLAPLLKGRVTFPHSVLSIVLWLGYCNSMLNPILYTIFSPDFKKAFRKMLMALNLLSRRPSL